MQVLQLPSTQWAKEVVEVGLHYCQGWMLFHLTKAWSAGQMYQEEMPAT